MNYNGFNASGFNPLAPNTIPNDGRYSQSYYMQNAPVLNPRKWVQGVSGAKSYLVAPNTSVDLWDSESNTIYVKSADASGMPSIKILDYTVRELNQNIPIAETNVIDGDYVSREDFEALRDELEALKGKLNNLKPCKCSSEPKKRENNLVKSGNGGNKR